MIVTALLAAALSGTPADRVMPIPRDARITGAVCPAHRAMKARVLRPEDMRGDAGAQTLGSLPPARMELPVSRQIAGCTAPLIVREDVQGDGRFARGR